MSDGQPQIPGLGNAQNPDNPPPPTHPPFDDSLYRWSTTGRTPRILSGSSNEATTPENTRAGSGYQPTNLASAAHSTEPSRQAWERPDNGFRALKDEKNDLFGDDPAHGAEPGPALIQEPSSDAPYPAASFQYESSTPQASASEAPETTQDKGKTPEKRSSNPDAEIEPSAKRRKMESEPIGNFTGLPEIFRNENFFPMWRGQGQFDEEGFFTDEYRYDRNNIIIMWDDLVPLLRKSFIVTVGAWVADDLNFTNMPSEWISNTRKFWKAVSDRWADEEACAQKRFPVVVGAYLFNLYHFNHRLLEIGKRVQARADNGGTPSGFGGDYTEALSQQEDYEWEEMEQHEEEECQRDEDEQKEREQKRRDKALHRQYYIDTTSDNMLREWLQNPVTERRKDLTRWLQEHSERLESIDRTDSSAAAEMVARNQQVKFLNDISERGYPFLAELPDDAPGYQEEEERQAEPSPAVDIEPEVDSAGDDTMNETMANKETKWAKVGVEVKNTAGASPSQGPPGMKAPPKIMKDQEDIKPKAEIEAKKKAISEIIAAGQASQPANEANTKRKAASTEEDGPKVMPKKNLGLGPKKSTDKEGREQPKEPKKKKEPKPKVRYQMRIR